MDLAKHKARLQHFETLCREQGLSLTIQRRVIFQTLLERDDHPTADQVYELVKNRIPGLSRTTVYRVLDTLVRIGAISKVCHPGAAARFDPKIHQHHHLVCLHCDSIVDLEDERLSAIELPAVGTQGFKINEFHIYLRGLCPKCRRKLATGQDKKPTARIRKKSKSTKRKITKVARKKRRKKR